MIDNVHHFAAGRCWVCGRAIAFDPQRVPTMPLDRGGEPVQSPEQIARRAPLCRACVVAANPVRADAGLPTWDDDESIWGPVRGVPE